MGIESVFPRTLFFIGPVPIRDTVLQTWIVVIVLAALAFWTSKKHSAWEPGRWQLALEAVYEYVENLIANTSGRPIPEIVPFLTTMISFVAISNLLGLLPLFQAPTRDLNSTLALSLISLGAVQVYGIRRKGLMGQLHSFIEPVAFMLPMNILGLISRTLSMTLRLFGNVIAGEIITGVLLMLMPVLAPLPFTLLGMLTGALQALVFTVLTLVFVAEAMGTEEPSSRDGVAAS